LSEQLDKEKSEHATTKEQLQLSSQLVAQLEIKLKQSATISGNVDVDEVRKQLMEEKTRADQSTLMLTQIRQILSLSSGPDKHSESTLLSKLQVCIKVRKN
jgi:hypothetical protein